MFFLENVEQGVRVRQVTFNSNAERAGIQPGDVLIQLDGEPINKMEDLVRRLQERTMGSRSMIRLLRLGLEKNIEVEFSD